MKSEFELAFNEITESRELPPNVVKEALQIALISAYRRDAGVGAAQDIQAEVDLGGSRPHIAVWVEKEVVDEVMDDRSEVGLETARYYHPECNVGDMVLVQAEGSMRRYGRIAAQTAKQVILQKIREAERKSLYDEYSARAGEVVVGKVQSVGGGKITLTLGRAEAELPRAQQIQGESYKPHDNIRVYIVEVNEGTRGPQIVVSRSHRNMLRRLLEYEVPEIYNGQVEIKSIAREAGHRSKVAVMALQDGIDPVGACVGMGGMRIKNIVKELHDERIDVIEWNPNQEAFVTKALLPARITGVYLEDDPDNGRTAVVVVPDEELSRAIGHSGQNARLAARLTGWRIDIKSVTEAVTEALDNLNSPTLKDLATQYADLVAEAQRIIEKRALGRPIMPEEYTTLGRFADVVQRKIMQGREAARQRRIAEINAVRATLPQRAFEMSVETLDLPDQLIEALQPMANVGEIMLRFLIDEGRLKTLLKETPPDSLARLQASLDKLVIPDEDAAPAAVPETAPVADRAVMRMDGVIPEGFTDDDNAPTQLPRREARPVIAPVIEPVYVEVDEEEDIDKVLAGKAKAPKTGKKKKSNRTFEFDESRGSVVVKRERKSGTGTTTPTWDLDDDE